MPPPVTNYADRQQAVLALNRIRGILYRQRNKLNRARSQQDPQPSPLSPTSSASPSPQRDIRLGLERVQQAVDDHQPWVGVHVGGTNGKGSICAFLAGLFRLHGVSFGAFTSPALPARHNSITLGDRYISESFYRHALRAADEKFAKKTLRWRMRPDVDLGRLTPFERETAAAFAVFRQARVKYGIVEVGMGGLTDATNVMKQKGVTVISKIGLDHQEYLGNTLTKIAKVKAGIMRHRVPCVVDSTNSPEVLEVLQRKAELAGSRLIMSSKSAPLLDSIDATKYPLEEYQKQNLACAVAAFQQLFPHLSIDINSLLATDPFPLGRIEPVSIEKLTAGRRQQPIIVDGSHNKLGMETLSQYVDDKLRRADEPITWVVGISDSQYKSFSEILDTIIRPQDNVAIVEYSQDTNDPPPASAETGRDYVKGLVGSNEQVWHDGLDIKEALQWASEKAAPSGPIVVTGSLYLIRQLYNLPGVSPSRVKSTLRDNGFLKNADDEVESVDSLLEADSEASQTSRESAVSQPDSSSSPESTTSAADHNHTSVTQSTKPEPSMPTFIASSHKIAEFHRTQVSELNHALRTLERQVEDLRADDTVPDHEDAQVVRLLRESEALAQLRTEQQAAYVRASARARTGRLVPRTDRMSDQEVLEWWVREKKRRARGNPIMRYSEPGWEPMGDSSQEVNGSQRARARDREQGESPWQGDREHRGQAFDEGGEHPAQSSHHAQ